MILFKSVSPISLITFDLDDTLYDNSAVIDAAMSWFDRALFYHPLLKGKYRAEVLAGIRKELVRVNPTLESDVTAFRIELTKRLFICYGISSAIALEEAALLVKRFIQVRSALVVPSVSFKVLRNLRRKYKLVAITNGNVDVDRVGIRHFFDFCLRADTKFLAKPQPDLFIEAARLAQIEISNSLHVGDDLVTDMQGAKNAGMHTCRYLKNFQDPIDSNQFCVSTNETSHIDFIINSLEELESLLL